MGGDGRSAVDAHPLGRWRLDERARPPGDEMASVPGNRKSQRGERISIHAGVDLHRGRGAGWDLLLLRAWRDRSRRVRDVLHSARKPPLLHPREIITEPP